MIKVDKLGVKIGNEVILEDCNALFERKKVNLIIGKSGSGKSVLLKTILGIFNFSEGKIFIDDISFSELNKKDIKKLRKQIGVVFQHGALFDSMNVIDNVSFPLRMFSKRPTNEIIERAKYCLNRVGLDEHSKKYVSELSGGMQKRVAIARAIVMNPKYLFCDEPNSGLDPKTSTLIDELIFSITKEYNITTIVNTHDLNSVLEIGENILFVNNKTTSWRGTKDNILKDKNKELSSFLYVNSIMKQIRKINND